MGLTNNDLLNWDDYRKEFNASGTLRLFIRQTGVDAWQKLFAFLLSTEVQLSLHKDESPAELPDNIKSVLSDTQHRYVLTICLDGITALSRPSAEDHIELLINPREIDSESKARILFRLMPTTGRTPWEITVLVRDNEEDTPVFEYVSGNGDKYLGKIDANSTDG